MGSHSLLQWIFPSQGLNPGLVHCRQILYHLSHQGSPKPTDKGNATVFKHRPFPECMLLQALCYQGMGFDLRKKPSAYPVAQIFIGALQNPGGLSMVSKEQVSSGKWQWDLHGRVESRKVQAPLQPGQKHSLVLPYFFTFSGNTWIKESVLKGNSRTLLS